MLAARLACLRGLPTLVRPTLTQSSPALRSTPLKTSQWLIQPNKGYATKSRFGIRRGKSAPEEIKEAAFEPSMETAARFDATGRLFVAGGAAVGLGALCYYGLGMSNEVGAIEKAVSATNWAKVNEPA